MSHPEFENKALFAFYAGGSLIVWWGLFLFFLCNFCTMYLPMEWAHRVLGFYRARCCCRQSIHYNTTAVVVLPGANKHDAVLL